MTDHKEIKNKSRPWIDQIQSFNELYREEEKKVEVNPEIKLGWVKGVLIPCLLSTWSVFLYFRIPRLLKYSGIFHSIIIILISMIILLITTISLSAISTNGKIKGGLYFIISRSIGPEFGAPIGILLAVANTVSVVNNTLLLCLSSKILLTGLYFIISRSIGPEFGAPIGILLAVASIVSAALNTTALCFFLTALLSGEFPRNIDLTYKLRGLVFIIIMSTLGCIYMDKKAKMQNAFLITIIFGILNIFIGSYNGPRDDSEKESGFTGFDMETFKQNWYSNYTIDSYNPFFQAFAKFFPSVTGVHAGVKYSSGDLKDPANSIPKGTLVSTVITATSYILFIVIPGSVILKENYSSGDIIPQIALWECPLYMACVAASISHALSALIFVTKLLQSMGRDDVYPLLKYLAKCYGNSKEPYRAYVFTMIVSSIIFLILDGFWDLLIPLATTCSLSAYAMINLCTFHAAYFKPLGWRPTYKYYNKWLSLAVAIICIIVMICINEITSTIVGFAVCVLYLLACRKNKVINWGSSKQTQEIKTIIRNVYKANTIQYHIKNYFPSLIVFSGNPESREKLVSLAHLITKNNGIQTCVNVSKTLLTPSQKKIFLDNGIQWLKNSGIKSLYVVMDNIELDLATHMMYSCGHGILRPNIAMVGYKTDWLHCPYQDIQTYLNILNVARMNNMSTIMVRVSSTESYDDQNLLIQDFLHSDENEEIPVADCFVKMKNNHFSFEKKKRDHGTVDVWWLYNDGGLSLIIAFILKQSITWKNCKFRIFGVTNKVECLSDELHKLKQLLSLYRIDFDYMNVILSNTTGPTTTTYFNSLLKRVASEENRFDDYDLQKEHIAETLFLRDYIELHSYNSDLIILTIPKSNEEINTLLFMCWIETISRGLPPCIMIHGSTEPVLTINA